MARAYQREEIKKILRDFKSRKVCHPVMDSATDELSRILQDDGGKRVVLLVGPTGVGKTEILLRCKKDVLKTEEQAMRSDPGLIPIAYVELRNPEGGNFDWKSYYCDTLIALNEPLIEKKLQPASPYRHSDSPDELDAQSNTLSALRSAVDAAFKNRRVKNTLNDEAQHLLRVSGAKRLYGQLETIKSLASRTGVRHVLCGTYDLLHGADYSGQLNRRAEFIHVRSYRIDDETDRNVFQAVVDILAEDLEKLGIRVPRRLSDTDYTMLKTIGRVGILVDWVYDGVSRSLWSGDRRLTEAALKAAELSNHKLTRMIQEEREGEAFLSDPSDDALMQQLYRADRKTVASSSPPVSRPKSRRKPGERNPNRDKVG